LRERREEYRQNIQGIKVRNKKEGISLIKKA